jgi:hypothetical protein
MQSVNGQSSGGLITIHYWLIWDYWVPFPSPLTTRSDYGGSILTRLHTGNSNDQLVGSEKKRWSQIFSYLTGNILCLSTMFNGLIKWENISMSVRTINKKAESIISAFQSTWYIELLGFMELNCFTATWIENENLRSRERFKSQFLG